MLDVSDIHLLKTISETGSINKAAKLLYMSQPTLSKRISRLEQTLNVELFHRHSTGMQPTHIANYLISGGKQIQTKLDAMCRHVELLSNLEGGTLHIGVSPIAEQLFFPNVLLDFIEETNNVEISFKVEQPGKLHQSVQDGEIDIAIGPLTDDFPSNELVATKAKDADIVFIVRQDHPVLALPQPIPMSELRHYCGIGPVMNQPIQSLLIENGLRDCSKITCDNYQISKSVVMVSDYFTGGPEMLFANELSKGELVKVKTDSVIPWQSYIITRAESRYAPTVRKFIEVLQQYAD